MMKSVYRNFFKPLADYLLALILLIIAAPLFLLFAILLKYKMKDGVFFTQSRPGKNGKLFKVIKFKTMLDTKDEHGNLLPDEQRLTRLGAFIRKTSLDELPQLLNVIRGDMSIVGPRPLLPQYLDLYSEEQARRHEVKPGITGWAQVNGRNAISWEEKFKLDVWYVNHGSFRVDLIILYKTIYKVIFSEGISDGVSPTMLNFKGSPVEKKDD